MEYRFEIWVPALFIGLGAIAIGFMWLGIRSKQPIGRILPSIFGLILMWGVAAPSFYFQKVQVSDEHLTDIKGIWFMPEVHRFEFATIRQLTIMMPKKGEKEQHWLFELNNQQTRLYKPSGLLKRNADAVIPALQAARIKINRVKAEG